MVRRLLHHVFPAKTHVRKRVVAIAFTAFVALVWLNQGTYGAEYEAARARTFESPGEHVVDLLRSPFMFLYRRSRDEALYFATASATLGQPYDSGVLAERGDSPLPPVTTAVDGRFHVPYAEVPFEYPPPNVVAVLLPRLFASRFATYSRLFGGLMGILLLVSAVVGARLGRAAADDDASHDDETKRIWAFGLLLLAHGALAIQRLDAIVALIAIMMVRAAVGRDDRALGVYGGLIGAAKLVPILILPVLILASGMRGTKRLVAVALGAAVGLAVGLGPMLLLGRESLPLLLTYHSARGLHVESSLGVVYGAVKVMLGIREAATLDYGSYNFHGPLSHVLAKLTMPLTVALVAVVGFAARRGVASDDAATVAERTERVVIASLGGMAALWLGGKVFSPQYLTWALPLVVALPGRSWRRAALGLGVVLLLSQIYLRGYYDHVHDQLPAGVITVVLRLAVLVALFVVALKRLRRGRLSR